MTWMRLRLIRGATLSWRRVGRDVALPTGGGRQHADRRIQGRRISIAGHWLRPVQKTSIEWHADDGRDEITITYEVRALSPTLTRFAQHDDLRLGARRALHPLMRVGIRHDIAGQLRRLRRILEARDPR